LDNFKIKWTSAAVGILFYYWVDDNDEYMKVRFEDGSAIIVHVLYHMKPVLLYKLQWFEIKESHSEAS
jgi:hypothetical protein